MNLVDEMRKLLTDLAEAKLAVQKCDPYTESALMCQNGHVVWKGPREDARKKMEELNGLERRPRCNNCDMMWEDERQDTEDEDFVYLKEDFLWSTEYNRLKGQESRAEDAYRKFCSERGDDILARMTHVESLELSKRVQDLSHMFSAKPPTER